MNQQTTSAGGVVARETRGFVEVLVVERYSNVEPKWQPVLRQLPKGGVESGESIEAAAVREVKEETGYDAIIERVAGRAAWSYQREGITWNEVVYYFVMRPIKDHRTHDREFECVRWVPLNEAIELLSYPEERTLLTEAVSCGALCAAAPIGNRDYAPSKAAWLARLKSHATLSVVDDFLVFSYRDCTTNRDAVVSRVMEYFPDQSSLIIRSSATGEDRSGASLAGVFRSQVVHNPVSPSELQAAINRVIESYAMSPSASHTGDEVIIQRYVTNVAIAGVVLTYDVWQDRPYYIINYDDESGRTDTVTAGIVSKAYRIPRTRGIPSSIPPRWYPLLDAAREIESLFPVPALNIEFAVTSDGKVHVFQVREIERPRTGFRAVASAVMTELEASLETVTRDLPDLLCRSDALPGSRTVLADMPDWNPAEILGAAPHPLDISLYRHLVTARAWNTARASLGYTDVAACELMLVLGCKPYIDVRVSLNSLTPAGLSSDARELIVSSGIERLCAKQDLQDKLEFELAFSTMDFCTQDRLKALCGETNFSIRSQILDTLTGFTNATVSEGTKRIAADVALVNRLRHELPEIPQCRTASDLSLCYRQVLRVCTDLGTIPFTRIARSAFVAIAFLRSARTMGLISDNDFAAFMSTLRTVATGMSEACARMADGTLAYSDFIKEFGHLRPRMYDITSMPYFSYGDNFWAQISKSTVIGDRRHSAQVNWGERLDQGLSRLGLSFDSQQLLVFARAALEAREYAKFHFSWCVSALLESTAMAADSMRISRDEFAFVTVEDILNIPMSADLEASRAYFLEVIAARKQHFERLSLVAMPSVIRDECDLFCVALHGSVPTFVTRKTVRGRLLPVSDVRAIDVSAVRGSVVLVEAADPGYDWVLSLRPSGIITRFGGAGSHMAVRCAELDIAAAIGCGEATVQRLKAASFVVLDCGRERLFGGDGIGTMYL